MKLKRLIIFGFLAMAMFARSSDAKQVPITDRYGLCADVSRADATIRIHAPIDVIFAVLLDKGRALVQFRIGTMPGEAFRTAEKLAEAHPGWSSGSFYFYGAVPGQGDPK